MNIKIEIEYIKRIERENEEQKKIIYNYREQNFELREDIGTLKNDLLRAEAMEDYWKINSSELEEDLQKLKKENKELNEFINHVKELSNYHERKKLEYKEENEKLKNKIFNYYN